MPPEIRYTINEGFALSRPVLHHSLTEDFAETAIRWLMNGDELNGATSWFSFQSGEGLIRFSKNGALSDANTTQVSGGDGTTNYMTLTATYTATQATTVTELSLVATHTSRASEEVWSTEGVDQDLLNNQTYTITWILSARLA